jgi:signal transduction histidine kinase
MVAAGVVAAALVVGGWLLVTVLRSNLEQNFDTTLTQQAQDRALLLDGGSAPGDLVGVQQTEAFAWIGTPDGTELAVGGSLRPLDPPLIVDPGTTGTARVRVEEQKADETSVEVEDHDLRIASAATRSGELVVVASELESVDRAVAVVRTVFVLGSPVLIALVAVLAWLSAGRALQPVERIRNRAARISGTNVEDRVPVPGGRDEIHDLAVTMNDMLGRLDEHQRSIRRFTADAGHELKSPMANIRALVETRDPDAVDWTTLQARLVTESGRAAALVDDLLFLAAGDEGAVPPVEPTTVHLDDIVFDAAERLAEMEHISVDIGEVTPVPVVGDRVLLDRVVRNLADNAARHADGVVAFSLRGDPGSVELRICDDGPGIPVEDREAVFDRFHRLDAGRGRASGGTGLGLAIARRIVTDHGGTIAVEDGAAGGACLTVRLPRPEDEAGPS